MLNPSIYGITLKPTIRKEVHKISSFGSKYFGWLLAVVIVLLGGWFLLPAGYNTLVLWLAPQLGNFIRPTLVMVNLLLVNPLTNITMVLVWAGAGFLGGVFAGTKKGAFVVGLMTWLTCLGALAFCGYLIFTTGLDLGAFPPLPPGSSLIDVLSIPIFQDMISQLLPLLGGIGGGGSIDFMALLTPVIIWFLVPVIVVIITGILGATLRPKEDF